MDDIKKSDEIKQIFNNISPRYDFVNNLISLWSHKFFKRYAIKNLKIKNGSKVLDLCCGSGDLSYIIKKNYPDCEVFGVDFSQNMLDIAKNKVKNVKFIESDAKNLCFDDSFFDFIVCGFGFRNIYSKSQAILEIKRTLKSEGLFLHLDFEGKKSNFLYDFFVLFLAMSFVKNFDAYKYLIKSKNNFYNKTELIELFSRHGFKNLKYKTMLFGTVSFCIFKKIN